MHDRSKLGILLLALAPLACAEDAVELVGKRADGIVVECSPGQADQEFNCAPQLPRNDGCAAPSAGGSALVLWPPNHKLHAVTLDACFAPRSACESTPSILSSGRIVAVTADEPIDASGDGETTANDMSIVDARTVSLRAERSGGGDGRVYRVEAEDASGHRETCEIQVPHDQGPFRGAVDSGEVVRVGGAD